MDAEGKSLLAQNQTAASVNPGLAPPESVLTDKGCKHFSFLIYDGHLRFFDLCISQSEDINL